MSKETTYRVAERTNYTHENTGANHNFFRTNDKCESIPELKWSQIYHMTSRRFFYRANK
jgi:hypothetical protein